MSSLLLRITSIACIVLLGATLVLGWLLKTSYEDVGKLQTHVDALVDNNRELSRQGRGIADSCKASNVIVADSLIKKESNDAEMKSIISELGRSATYGKAVSRNDVLGDDADRLLKAAECKARNGGDCTP